MLKIENQNAKKIADRLNMLNALNANDEVSTNIVATDEIFLTTTQVTCVPPTCGFIHLSISRTNP